MKFPAHPRRLKLCMALLCAVVLLGCEESVYEPYGPELPITNERILVQRIQGTPAVGNSIYEIYDDGAGGFYSLGLCDDKVCIGTLDRNGQTGWIRIFEDEDYEDRPRSLLPLSGGVSGLNDAVIAVGGFDINGDDNVDQAYARIVGTGGVVIDELIISKADTALILFGTDAIGPSTFVSVGGAKIDDVYYPFVVTFEIEPDSTLAMHNNLILSEYSDEDFIAVRVDPSQVSGNDFLCYVSAWEEQVGTDEASIAIHEMTGSTVDAGAFDVTWTVEIAKDDHLDIWSYPDCLDLYDGSLYFAGGADVDKESDPSDGYWNAGFVASVSTGGALNWMKMISISTHSDYYNAISVMGGAIYAGGIYDSYYKTSSGVRYGLALLSIFDPMTGDEIYHLGFGSDEYRSGFNTLIADGASAFCGGYTSYSTSEGRFRSWFAEIDVDNLDGAVTSELPPMSPALNGVACPPARSESTADKDGGWR